MREGGREVRRGRNEEDVVEVGVVRAAAAAAAAVAAVAVGEDECGYSGPRYFSSAPSGQGRAASIGAWRGVARRLYLAGSS